MEVSISLSIRTIDPPGAKLSLLFCRQFLTKHHCACLAPLSNRGSVWAEIGDASGLIFQGTDTTCQ